jgi:hypothetical protein
MWRRGDKVEQGIRKLYSINEIGIAALLGGPLAGFYMISRNFKSLDKKLLSRTSFIFGVIATIFLGAIIVLIPKEIIEKIPDLIIPVLFVPFIYVYAKKVQGRDIDDHFKNGWVKYSQRRTVVIGVLTLLITMVCFFALGKIFGSINVSVF